MKNKIFILLLALLSLTFSFSQNEDSLWRAYNNTKQKDSIRLDALNQLCWSYLFNDTDSAYKLIRIYVQNAQDKHYHAGASYNLFGIINTIQGELHLARKHYLLAIKIFTRQGLHQKAAGLYNNIGMTYRDVSAFDSANYYFNKAIDLAKSCNDTSVLINANLNIGLVYNTTGNDILAIKAYHESLKFARLTFKNDKEADILLNLSNIYIDQDNFNLAREELAKALIIYKKQNVIIGIANVYGNYGTIAHELKEFDTAFHYQHKSLQLRQQIKDFRGEAVALLNLGKLFQETKNFPKSNIYFKRCLDIVSPFGDKQKMSSALASIGFNHFSEKKYALMIEACTEAYALAKEIGAVQEISSGCECLELAYKTSGNFEKAYKFANEKAHYNDSISNGDKRAEITRIQLTYEYEQLETRDSIASAFKDREILSQKIEIEKAKVKQHQKNLYLNVVILGLLIVILIAFMLFRRFRFEKKQRQNIATQKKIIEEKQKEIVDSITYAKRIQDALLKSEIDIQEHLPDYFILYKPKDIVSGDFYWGLEKNNYFYAAVADCTGHGVPGAFLTMLGTAYLNEINSVPEILDPAEILNRLRKKFINELKQDEGTTGSKDGMDISLIRIDLKTKELVWSGANNSLYVVTENELTEFKPDKEPIGYHSSITPFTNHCLKINNETRIFLFSDGFSDQFGGPKGKKFKSSNFKEVLVSTGNMSIQEQGSALNKVFMDWKENFDQIDDVCVFGISIC